MLDGLTANKLLNGVEADYAALAPARTRRRDAYASARTRWHPSQGKDAGMGQPGGTRRPVNLGFQQLRTIITHTAFKAGAAEIKPRRAGLEEEAELWTEVADRDTERLAIGQLLQDLVFDAVLSGISFIDTGLRGGRGIIKAGDGDADPGSVYSRLVTLDDYAHDATAKRRSQMGREELRYRVSKQEVVQGGYFGVQPYEAMFPDLQATPEEAAEIIKKMPSLTEQTASDRDQPSSPQTRDAWRLDPMIELWDVFIMCRGEVFVATIPSGASREAVFKSGMAKILHLERHDGPGMSRLTPLVFLQDPDSIVPTSLDGFQRDIATIADLLANKLFNQALRLKRNKIVRAEGRQVAMALEDSLPDEWMVGDPKDFADITSGGLVPECAAAFQQAQAVWDTQSANVAVGGGLRGPENNDTAAAFNGAMAMVTGYLDYLRTRVADTASGELDKRMRLIMGDPLAVHSLGYRLAEDVTVDVEWSPEMRRGRAEDFKFGIRQHSTAFEDQAVAARRLVELHKDVIPAVLETAAKYGLDPRPTLRELGRRFDQPNLAQMVPDPEMLMVQQAIAAAAGQPTQARVAGRTGGGGGEPAMQNPIDVSASARASRVPA